MSGPSVFIPEVGMTPRSTRSRNEPSRSERRSKAPSRERNQRASSLRIGGLIAEPVGTFHRIVEVIVPVVLVHIAERRTDTALRCDRV